MKNFYHFKSELEMACTPFKKNNAKGFTLVELTAVVMIAMLITFIIFRLSNSIKGREKLSGTRARMEMISAKIKQYYRAHEQLPFREDFPDQVPVQPDALNMEQKYRLDEWGAYFVYNPTDPLDLTNIQDVDGYAATIISAGPDQLIDLPGTDQEIQNNRDNLIVYIDLTQEATDIVLNKLKVLQEKVVAYDAMFTSVDNDADGEIDETPREAADIDPINMTSENCPPTSTFDNNVPPGPSSINNDPSEGLTTLDAIEDPDDILDYAPCSPDLACRIVKFYDLKSNLDPNTDECIPGPGVYSHDPWLRPFFWGYPDRDFDNGVGSITDQDRRYHRFYSLGPDGVTGPGDNDIDDDITYSAK